ncbi:MAG TPA: mechanosensitive ion channel domain-containing protein [Terriglobales bacterium]|nr:mechanosensitive ion channel domain-containing protein [Terriglobales bacterium]
MLRLWTEWLRSPVFIVAALAVAWVAHRIAFAAGDRLKRSGASPWWLPLRHSRRPALWTLLVIGVMLALPALRLPAALAGGLAHALELALIAALAWWMVALTRIADDFVARRFDVHAADNLAARRVQTQMQLLRRVFSVAVAVVALAIMLMTFPAIRQIGTGLFASAGVAGLVIGMAARPTLASLIAGVQVALTEPIRLDDAVVVEGEWGWIEEIGTTYVVVRIWDLRRLVLPLTYFIEKPFQNWTRHTANLLGSTYLYVDYSTPVEELRAELLRILQSTPLWDGKVQVLQVSDATEHTLQLRALMSARNSGQAWDLRCLVREKLIAYLQQQHPECLPRVRGEIIRERAAARPIAAF